MSIPDSSPKVYVVVPAYNEEATIRTVVEELAKMDYRVVVVDDGSTIPLSPFLKGLDVWVLRHRINLGQGAALQTGIEFALQQDAAFIVTFDADGQHTAEEIADMLQRLTDQKLHIVLGSRFLQKHPQGMPGSRRMLLRFARFINYFFTGLLLTDAHNGLRVMSREAASRIRITENGMSHATQILREVKKQRLRYEEFPVTVRYSRYSLQKGQSNVASFRIILDIILNRVIR